MKNYFKKIAFSVLLMSSLLAQAGQIQPITGILRTTGTTTIINGSSVIVEQTSLPSAGVSADYNVVDLISLNLDNETTHFFNTPTSFNIDLSLKSWNASGTLTTHAPFTLTVSSDDRYNKQTIDKAIKKITHAYKLEITITGMTQTTSAGTIILPTLPDYLYVEGEINMIRYYNYLGAAPVFNPMGITALDIDCDGTPDDEMKVKWGTVVGAEEYQLEWSFVNDYGVTGTTSIMASSLFADFKNNSTRITTAATEYNVSLLFEKGYIAFRVRGVGRDYLNPDKFIYGNWSSGPSDLINIATLSSLAKFHNTLDHESEKNWQYAVTFAEEGKKKEVVSYFDGSLHNRQSVTKVNSDNNVIVGETIYDYQGRPAVNVLPTPVAFLPSCSASYVGPSLKYYYKYNRDILGNTYSKDDFDLDFSGTCAPSAAGMDSISGSSQYYSASNPNKVDFQAFVPRAEMFPFSQVEYTPDNTGRIRSQSGVGKKFQLGSTHETKYFYSHPNQIQLDRLFGSEVGDVAHYKKNTVIDANGQVSVSYLNQEGKTIATALAGDPPIADGVVFMEPLPSAGLAAVTLTVDAFSKDANGNSLTNTITALEDGISFSTQLSVSYNSNYNFTYDLVIDTLYDHCISDTGFCISCIYDLEIKVLDECGVNLLAASPVNKRIGHLDPAPNGFTMNCILPSETTEADAFTLYLTPGVYTVSKVLTLNKDARDFYVEKYLDPVYNTCIKSEAEFIEEALANVDTSACNITCETCALALGTEDDFVAAGKGTAIQYQYLFEQCMEPCRPQTLCSNAFEMMLVDVSPGGQYGKFNASTVDASGEVYSVFNHSASNFLPSYSGAANNILPANTGGNWRYPALIMNGIVHKMYLDDTGDRLKVNVFLTSTAGVWNPAVQSGATINTDPVTGQTYVYPENLQNLSDFMAVWNINFAKSLVIYHPEYAYYIACKDQDRIPAGLYSTEGIDSLMIITNTFADAIAEGFIDASTLQPVDLLNVPVVSTHVSDPFFAQASSFDNFYGPFNSSYTTLPGYVNADNLVGMAYKMDNYLDIGAGGPGTTFLSMMETAAAQARCGNNFTGPTGAPCTSFGTDYFYNPGGDLVLAAMNDSIRNQEWQFFKNFYMAEKHKFQFLRMNFFAKYLILPTDPNMPAPDVLGGCNACIGNTSYNPFTSGMYTYTGSSYSLTGAPVFDPSQPCSFLHFYGFNNSNFSKRFVDPANNGLNPDLAEYTLFQQTGQCPVAFKLSNFLNTMAQGHYLYPTASTLLGGISTFVPELYTQVCGGTNPPIYVNYRWDVVSTTATDLTVNIVDPSTSTVMSTLTLNIALTPIADFTKIVSFQNLRYGNTVTGIDDFTVQATYLINAFGGTATEDIVGSSNINIHDCPFEPTCTANQLATDYMNLKNISKAVGFENSTFNMSASGTVAPTIGSALKTELGFPNNNLIWNYVSAGNKVEIFDNSNPGTKLVFSILSVNPSTAIPSIISYANIQSNFNNLFKMNGLDAAGNIIAEIDGKAEKSIGGVITPLSMGDCGLPPSPDCNSPEHQVRNDLEALLHEALTESPFTGNINLFAQSNFTPLLQSYIDGSTTSTSSTYTFDAGASTSFDTLIFNIDGQCNMSLRHDLNHLDAIAVNFTDLAAVSGLTGIPPLDGDNNYHDFYFIGTYNSGSGPVTDTVWGTSCFPLKNCDVCLAQQIPSAVKKVCLPPNASDYIDAYNNFVTVVNNYNTSPYATFNMHTVIPPSFGDYILSSSLSICYSTYESTLIDYTSKAANDPAPIPYDPCGVVAHDDCEQSYVDYTQAIYDYNTYAAAVGYVQVSKIYTLGCFEQYFCTCVDRFVAGLTTIINGTVAYPASNPANALLPVFFIEQSCDFGIYICDVPDTAFVFPTMPYSPNPCVVQAIAAATQNAINQYNLYADSAATDFITRYNEHCLHPIENLHYAYTDKEYHFTLYYYDQAGNLVKTIPPEGLEFLPITSDVSPLELQVKQDRLNNTQTVYTSHRMATTYEYNSLNQLVRQDMPDHDKMDICESILPNGLDMDLTITSMQYVNASKGYLIGHLTRTIAGTPVDRGYVYTTNNGGQSWTLVTGLTAGDIRKVQMISTTEGYAVSNYGLVFKTLDGGASWDAITSLYNSPTQYFGDLNDLYFNSATTGIVGGISNVYKTTNAGLNWLAGTGFTALDTITGLTYDGSNYFASVKKQNHGKVYASTDGLSWTLQTNYSANDLKKVQYMSNNDTAFAVANDGTLLRSNSTNTSWELLPTNSPYNFSDIFFKNGREGIALIETATLGKYAIYKTFDSGKNWALLSDPGKFYSSLQAYDPINNKVIASGDAGNVAKVLMSLPPFGMSDISHNLSTASSPSNLSYAHAVPTSAGKVASLAVSTSNTMIYFNYNTDNNWETFTVSASGLSGFKKSLISLTPGISTEVKGIMLGNDGIIYEFYRSNSTSTPVYTAVTTSSTNFTDISTSNALTSGVFFGFDATSKTIYRITYSGTSAVATATTGSVSPSVINSISVNNVGTEILLAGNDGATYHSTSSILGSSITWLNTTEKVIPLSINDITAVGTNNVVAVGNDGTQWYTSNAGTNWKLAVNNTGVKLNAIALDASQNGLVAGNDGTLFNVASAITGTPVLTQITTGLTSNLNDVAIQSGGTGGYAVAQNGKAVFVSNYFSSASSVTSLAYNVNGALNGVSFIPGSFLALTVGDKSGVMMFVGSTGSAMNQVFTKPLQSVSFFDNNNGYVVDNSSVFRHTTNGGNTWNVVLPNPTLPAIAKVNARTATKALIVGANEYVAQINNEAIPVTIAATGITSDFRDIVFNGNGYGVIVGSNAWAARITSSGATYTVTSIGQVIGGGVDFNTVHVFNNVNNPTNDKHFIAAGTNGKVYYHNSSTGLFNLQSTNITSTAVLNDIYFRDDRVGYVVGNDGEAYKCVLSANINELATLSPTAVVWNDLCPLAIFNGRTPADVDFNTIAFSSPVNGFLAGSFDAVGNHLHAILLSDESMMYSTRFWYDRLGRMVVSQNTKQYNKKFLPISSPSGISAFSYTLYDELGRIKEVAEKAENTSVSKYVDIFGTNVNGFYNTKVIDDAKLLAWINDPSGARTEATKTYYDVVTITGLPIAQDNLRKRVASVTYEDLFDNNDQTYQHATHYTYDIHGNVNTLLQDNKKLFDEATASGSSIVDQRFKQIDYDYDLISGKVNKVTYQPNQTDQFIHRYAYDSDNRITKVETSTDNVVWDMDAKYFYYAHGPLARVELGTNKVQGMDYAYTLQGWIKGVNSNTLNEEREIGQDGYTNPSVTNLNQNIARDAFGYTLKYFKGDYNAISGLRWNNATDRFEAVTVGSQMDAARYDLFNGNISSAVTTIEDIDTTAAGLANAPIIHPLGNAYKYDQLNRLKRSSGFENIDIPNNIWLASGGLANKFENTLTYDANGNILTQNRSDENGVEFDAMVYDYKKSNAGLGKMLQNRLYHVNDNPLYTAYAGSQTEDIEDQGLFLPDELNINIANNYGYDGIGNLIRDNKEEIEEIQWTVYGKIKRIIRPSTSTKDNLEFDYDASGNRISKKISDAGNNWKYTTYYVRDAQGNVMSIYDHKLIAGSPGTMSYKLIEQDIFGSSRIGLSLPDKEMIMPVAPLLISHTLGKKQYELNDWLGSISTIVTDRKIPVADITTPTVISFYLADVNRTESVYPFGMGIKTRSYVGFQNFRYSFNGKEKTDEISGEGNSYDYGARIYDSRICKFFSVDPMTHSTPWYSSYSSFGDNPIFNIDVEGKTKIKYLTIIHEGVTIKVKLVDNNYTKAVAVTVPCPTTMGIMNKVIIRQYDVMETQTINLDDPSKSVAKQETLLGVTENFVEKKAREIANVFKEGSGESQNGGFYLVSVDGGASATKTKSKTKDLEHINIEDFLTAIGALGAINKVDAGILSDGLDIQRSVVEEFTKAKPAGGSGIPIDGGFPKHVRTYDSKTEEHGGKILASPEDSTEQYNKKSPSETWTPD